MAAITIAVAQEKRAATYHINDLNEPLVKILQIAVEEPFELIKKYTLLWEKQFNYKSGHVEHFYCVRNEFNNGDKSAENMLAVSY